MSSKLRPMLAEHIIESEDDLSGFDKLRFPMFASPKIDGWRMRVDPILGAVSRTHQPIPNRYLQEIVKQHPWMHYLDGEITVDDPTSPNVFNRTQSAFSSHGGQPNIYYHVFDHWQSPEMRYDLRNEFAQHLIEQNWAGFAYEQNGIIIRNVSHLKQKVVNNVEEVLAFEEECLTAGFEGLIVRSIDGRYKNGRSTLRENLLLKLKRTFDDEAIIVGFERLERNTNELTRNAFGLAKRSAHRAGMVAVDLAGKILVTHPVYGGFSIGSGLDDALRADIFQNFEAKYKGKKVTYKYTKVGMKDKPRHPIFKGVRHD